MLLQHMAMQLPDRELKKGSAELLILSLLEDRPRHGYEIGQLIHLRSRGALRFTWPRSIRSFTDWKSVAGFAGAGSKSRGNAAAVTIG